jgi:inosose dehydratase
MHAAGYAGTELGDWGFMPTDPDELREELDERRLALIGSWVSVRLHDADSHRESADDAVRTAKQLARVGGPESVVVLGNDPYGDPYRTKIAGRVRPSDSMPPNQWQVFADGANHVARRVMDEAGIRTVIHQHIGTLIETEAEARRLFDMTDPSILGLCLDTGHWTFGAGGDPVAAVREFRDVSGTSTSRTPTRRSWRPPRQHGWDGPESVGHGVFCEPAPAASTSPASWRRWTRSATAAGSSSNGTCCPGWRQAKRAAPQYLRRSASGGARPPSQSTGRAAGRSNVVAIVTSGPRAPTSAALHHLHRVQRHLAARPGQPTVADRVRQVHEADAPAVVLVRRRGERCAMGTSVQAGNRSARGTRASASRRIAEQDRPPNRFGRDSGSRSGMEIVPSVP